MLSTLSQTNFDLNVVECKNTSMNGGIGQYDFIVPTPTSTTTVAAAAAAAAAITGPNGTKMVDFHDVSYNTIFKKLTTIIINYI